MFSLPREYTGHSKHPLPTTQEKTTYGHHQMVNIEIRLIIFFAAKDGEALYCGSDHELLITKFRLKLKEVGKTTRPFRYQFSSAQSCLTLCDLMDCSMPALPVHHQLLEITQTDVHLVGDAIQPSQPLSSPSPPVLNLSQHQGLFK